MFAWWIIVIQVRLRRLTDGMRDYLRYLRKEFHNMDRNVTEWDLVTAIPARTLTPHTASRHMERRGQK